VIKIHTIGQLQSALDNELAWRVKEIADLKYAIKQSKALAEGTLIRAGVALLYAHWEGFIKSAATAYLNFVSCQGLNYRDLQSCFAVRGLKKHLYELSDGRNARLAVVALEFLRAGMHDRAELQISNAIDKGNLKAEVFENIAWSIGISATPYESKFKLVDESLLKRRNKIAHGEFVDIDGEGWRDLAGEVLLLLRQFKTDIENAASLSAYRATPGLARNEPKSANACTNLDSARLPGERRP